MAYDFQMSNIVELIDFFNEKTSTKIVKYIGKNLLKTNDIRNKECLKLIKKEKLLEKRLLETFGKKDDSYKNSSGHSKDHGSSDFKSESVLYEEDILDTKNDYSEPIPTLDLPNFDEIDTEYEYKVTNNLSKSITKRLREKQSNPMLSNDIPTRKDFTFKGYKIEFNITYVDDRKPERNVDTFKQNNKKRSNSVLPSVLSAAAAAVIPRPKTSTNLRIVRQQDNIFTGFKRPTIEQTKFLTVPYKNEFKAKSRPLTGCSSRSLHIKSNDGILNNSLNTKTKSYKDSYLNSLKKSGLSNDYCIPIIRSRHISGVIAAK
jgi:hypothetical protein